jgi:hypothetical protein
MLPSKEMCHEDIHRRSRLDLADRDPVAHRDCKRSPRVPVELRVREQRLLTISGASERFCPRLKICIRLAAGLHPRVGRPLAARSISPMKRFYSPRRLLSGSSMARLDVRMSARGIKAKQGRLRVVDRG